MTERMLVPLPDGRWLALSREAFDVALAEGAQVSAPPRRPQTDDGPLLDAEELSAALKLPTTWIEQAAREQRIPSIQAGRWRRFRRSDVERTLAAGKAGSALNPDP